jgi:aspartate aminotransferase-like enzyme
MRIKRQTILNVIEGLGFEARFRTHALHPNAIRVVVEELNINTTGDRRVHPRIESPQALQVLNFVNSLEYAEADNGQLIL